MIDMWAITPVLIKNSVFIMHLIIAPKIEFVYFFLTHCTKLTKNHENKFASTVEPLLYDHPQNHIGVVV